ncbi:MAG: metallophosphoesterase [Bryobacteraceae bacterium]
MAGAAAAAVSRQPYLQAIGTDRASVLWATRGEAGTGAATLAQSGSPAITIKSTVSKFDPAVTDLDTPLFQHRADFTGLKAATEYVYTVTQDGVSLTPEAGIRFRTDGPGPVRFVVFGDSGDGGGAQLDLAKRISVERADLAIHTGDIAYQDGTFAQFDQFFFGIYGGLLSRAPLYPVVGNHEYHTREAFPYRAVFVFPTDSVPEADHGRYYSFDRGPIHFTMLDSNWPLLFASHGAGPMIRWLEEDLRRTGQRWRVVGYHHTAFPNGHHLADENCLHARRWLVPIMERHGVNLVLSGHEHNYQRTAFRREGAFAGSGPGTVFVTTGGAGSFSHAVEAAPELSVTSEARHYLVVEADNDTMRVKAIGLAGETVDEFSIQPPPALDGVRVRDSASFAEALAPGALFSVFASDMAASTSSASGFPLPAQLGGATLTIGSRTVPLLFASPGQINAQIPFDVEGPAFLRIATGAGARTVPLRVARAAPAIFLSGGGPALIHANGHLVSGSEPAARGEWLALFLTGLGPVKGSVRAGEVSPSSPLAEALLPVHVEIADWQADIAFAGLAPGMAGVNQVNFRVPDATDPGQRPMRVCAGASCSNVVQVRVQ